MNGAETDLQAVLPPRSELEKTLDRSFIWLTRLFAYGIALVLLLIALSVTTQAWPAIKEFGLGFLWNSSWNPVEDDYGALPTIVGTMVSSLIALLLAVPLGVGAAIFLSEDFIPLSV
ncbi:MAG: phosphate ABC transporter permease subunit PstC, partial [Cyanobacteria bacterium J06641_5]